ncbi:MULTISPECIES: YSC84-related protein [unclassified Ruegeria]|uniref:lipid-binding SYLF domain-containing protein n=1 Tax=unclassified Ruegeria TaxID=2625375 RepID=UPI001489E8F4|nr:MULTISPECIES: YSC84-related protein [unclassified Ruegeria]NOD34024.1 twin-arginine translocation pathway signal [Ruegeria sp. HKCCD7296]NOE32699.1 twin-arginine translocation pathway signal [Ruegeria sp. HKCCD7318]NOE41048.1 twin-arginine translocation pathway signal [Ruegeria sp. HKCCD7319]
MSSSPSPRLSRRGFAFGMAGLTLTAACGNGVGNSNAATIDARVDATLTEMYAKYPNTVEIANKANGMLVMPLITDAGLIIFGGAYGQGALRINGATVDYYSAISGTAGLQFGAQQYAHVLFFMTEAALNDFRRSSGWTAGADIGYVVDSTGNSLSTDTTTLRTPVLAAVFGQAGLKFGATIEGTKYTRIIP